jgi:hypothetical protein
MSGNSERHKKFVEPIMDLLDLSRAMRICYQDPHLHINYHHGAAIGLGKDSAKRLVVEQCLMRGV